MAEGQTPRRSGPDGSAEGRTEILVERARLGDVEAFVELVRPLQAPLRAFCARVAFDADEADDLAQEALLAAFGSLGSFERGGDLGRWLRGIARNKAREARRRRAVERDALDRVFEREAGSRLSGESEAAGSESEELLVALRRCLEGLGEKARRLLELVYLERLPGKEAAGSLGMSLGALYTALTRARQALRRCVGERLA